MPAKMGNYLGPAKWGITLALKARYWGYTMALDSLCMYGIKLSRKR
jgi:hypothetical protein